MAESLPDQSTLSPDEQAKLRDLTAQSWNLELVISGAALFAILQLPDLFDQGFANLRYNFLTQTTGLVGQLPILILGFMKVMCYVLFLAFLTNFVMRAFWVGLVGLLAVYPTGIQYDKIPFSTLHPTPKNEWPTIWDQLTAIFCDLTSGVTLFLPWRSCLSSF